MKELASILSRSYDIEFNGEGFKFPLKSKGGYYCELYIGPESLEWYVLIKEELSSTEVFNEWYDYQGYDNTSENLLIQNKMEDILRFVKNWESAEQVRISKFKKYFGLIKNTYCELLIEDEWIKI